MNMSRRALIGLTVFCVLAFFLSPAEAFLKPKIIELPSLLKLEASEEGKIEAIELDMVIQGVPAPFFTVTPELQNGIVVKVGKIFESDESKFAMKVTVSGTPVDSGTFDFKITATNSQGSDSKALSVSFAKKEGENVPVGSILISENKLTLNKGATAQLSYTITPPKATNKLASWHSNNPAVATVDVNGLIKGMGAGTAIITITAQQSEKSKSCEVTVSAPVVNIPVTDVKIGFETLDLEVDDTAILTCSITPPNATDQSVKWSTSAPDIVSVTSAGLLKALSPGNAVITADVGGSSGSCKVTIKAESVPVSAITLTTPTLSMYKDAVAELFCTVTPVNATNKVVDWKSSNTDVMKVDSKGTVYAVGTGSATVTATTQDESKTASCVITVSELTVNIPVDEIVLEPSQLALNVGETKIIAATIKPTAATNQQITWSTSDARVVSIGSDGTATALSGGSAEIIAESDSQKATTVVTVFAPPASPVVVETQSVVLTPSSITLDQGGTAMLSFNVQPQGATNKAVAFTTSNPAVATVDSDGLVVGISTGSAVITIKTQGGSHTATCNITIRAAVTLPVPVSGVHLNLTSSVLKVGEKIIINTEISPPNAQDQSLTWFVDKPDILSVTSNGTLTALSPGIAVITVKSNADPSKSATLTVTVESNTVPVSGVFLTPPTLSDVNLTKGDRFVLSYDLRPTEASNKIVRFTSSNPAVATVDADSTIHALMGGRAVITLATQDGSFTATCEVDINATPDPVPTKAIELNADVPKKLHIGDVVILNVVFTPPNATSQDIKWATGDPLVLSIAADGTLSALAPGTTTVKAQASDGPSAFQTITVVSPDKIPVPVKSISLPKSLSMTAGKRFAITFQVDPPDASNRVLFWSTSNPNVVTVDADGLVYATGSGTAEISVTTQDGAKQTSCTIVVSALEADSPLLPSEIDIIPDNLELDLGQRHLLSYTIFPVAASEKSLIWTSDVPKVATVDEDGLVSALAEGVAKITATTQSGGVRRSCSVVVTSTPARPIPVESVTVYPETLKLHVGGSRVLNALISPDNAMDHKVYWSSNNITVAQVATCGLVQALSPGTAVIKVETNDGEKTVVCALTVIGDPIPPPPERGSGGGCSVVGSSGSILLGLAVALFFFMRRR